MLGLRPQVSIGTMRRPSRWLLTTLCVIGVVACPQAKAAASDTGILKTSIGGIDTICDKDLSTNRRDDAEISLDWRKFTETLIGLNGLGALYVSALEACRADKIEFAEVAANVATFGQTPTEPEICNHPAKTWPDPADKNAVKTVKTFAAGFVRLLVAIQTGEPQDLGNGIILRHRSPEAGDDPVPAPQAAEREELRQKAVRRYLADMQALGKADETKAPKPVSLIACYRPGGIRRSLAKFFGGKTKVTLGSIDGSTALTAADGSKHDGKAQPPVAGKPSEGTALPIVAGVPGQESRIDSNSDKIHFGGSVGFNNFSLRAYPSQLAEVSNPASDSSADPALSADNTALYFAGEQAKLSFSEQSGSNVVSNNIVGALGFKIPVAANADNTIVTTITPYYATDREVKYTNTHTSISTAFSTNTWNTGAVVAGFWNLAPGPWDKRKTEQLSQLYVIIRPDHLGNYLDHSELWSINARLIPVVTGPIFSFNTLQTLFPNSDIYEWSFLFDVRYQRGWFTARGDNASNLRLNEDFSRLGAMAGAAIEINWLEGNPIDLSALYVDFIPLEGFKKSLGFFQTQGTFNLGASKNVGVTAAYENGRRDDTAQRYEAWSISLSFKF